MTLSKFLNVWRAGRHVGVFKFDDTLSCVGFSYDPETTVPISLSMPIGHRVTAGTARCFLEGLLPDDGNDRLRMKMALDADSDEAYDLLDAVDTVGGLVLTKADTLPDLTEASVVPMRLSDISSQMARAKRKRLWWDASERERFSLAGNQPKFTLCLYDGFWYWPNAVMASTHIVKPDLPDLPCVSSVESASMSLARLSGLCVPLCTAFELEGRTGYLVERFDRMRGDDGLAVRLHVEDLCQALGRMPGDKYDVTFSDIATLLSNSELMPDETVYDWVGQVAFNTYIGNCDAHAKNYSIYLNEGKCGLTPLYDSVNTTAFGVFQNLCSMEINGKSSPRSIGLGDWYKEAKACGLDPDRVVDTVSQVACSIREHLDEVSPTIDEAIRDGYLSTVLASLEAVSLDSAAAPVSPGPIVSCCLSHVAPAPFDGTPPNPGAQENAPLRTASLDIANDDTGDSPEHGVRQADDVIL